MAKDEEYTHHLLDQNSECSDSFLARADAEFHRPGCFQRWRGNTISTAILLLLLYIAVVETVNLRARHLQTQITDMEDDQPHFIPKGTLEYEHRKEWTSFEHPWNIAPSPELDDIWEEFLYARNVRVTHDELIYLNENLTDLIQVSGKDYPGVLGVFHHLHCLNSLRKIVHWDYYEPLMVNDTHPEGFSKAHSDHCIDSIRQALMCHANTAIYTAEWLNDSKHPINKELKSNKHATCVKWDSLDGWARQRALVPGHFHYLPGPYGANRLSE